MSRARRPPAVSRPARRDQPAGAVPVLERLDAVRWRIPRDESRGMRVDGIVFANEAIAAALRDDQALAQVANVATLPGIVGASLAMPDIHWGYGFPVGGVAATRVDGGVISPGGIGFDINCGVRLLRSDVPAAELAPHLPALADALFTAVPSGLGAHRRPITASDLESVLDEGAAWAVEQGHGSPDDLRRTEEGGRMAGAQPAHVSRRARERGLGQLGTLGSGNHFLEVQIVERVDDLAGAEAFGLWPGQAVVMIHCGSRGLGHQVCTDHVAVMDRAVERHGITLPDRQLACVPLGTPEADEYLGAMVAAANFAWANRQMIAAAVRGAFARVLGQPEDQLGLRQVYDLSHNLAKFERHEVDGRPVDVCVHRKGATRAFPAGHPDVPEVYRRVGQPVLVPGDMGRYSFVAVGMPEAMTQTFGSSCHGAGRSHSRHAALRALRGVDVAARLEEAGIVVRADRRDLLAEEASFAYKDVADVMATVEAAGIARSVARLRPLAVIKG